MPIATSRRARLLKLLSLAIASMSLPAIASGQTSQYVGGDSDWNTPTNWNPSGVPGASDQVYVTESDGVSRTITYDYPGPAVTLADLYVDLTNNVGNATTTLNVSGNTLTATQESIGYYGVALFNQTGGKNILGGPEGSQPFLYLGYNVGTTGTYALAGSGALLASIEYVGYNGVGIFNQSAGTNTVTSVLYVGNDSTGASAYSLSGNAVLTGGSEFLFTGNFNQSGGSNSVSLNHSLIVGSGGTATYVLSGGSFTASADEYLGDVGEGIINQSGGTNSVVGTNSLSNNVFLGYQSSSIGIYLLSGGVASIAGSVDVGGSSLGPSGTGLLTVSNTAHLSVAGPLQIYSTGQANINGGTTTVGGLVISTGGTLNANAALTVTYTNGRDPIKTIDSYLADGYNGQWSSGEITSSDVTALNASQSALIYAVGSADGKDGIVAGLSSGEIEILPTLAGDALLEGNVNFGDFQLLAANFGSSAGWDGGNFTYGSIVNFGDFQLLAQNFGANSSALTATELAPLNNFASQFGDKLEANSDGVGFSLVSVPEPASAALVAMSGIALLRARRRKL